MPSQIDKDAVFNWLHKNAAQAQKKLEKGLQKGIELRNTINSKIESSPRAKQARDKAAEFVRTRSERLADVRIGGKRVGDLPNAAQRMIERQLYKVILKLHEAEPDMNWDSFMPNPEEMPIFAAFETLGLPYGTSFDEVKKTYRRLMREYHPDKHSESPEAERIATEKTQELTAAYELISQHYGK